MAFHEKQEVDTIHIKFGLAQIIPLAQINKEEILALTEWAKSGRIRYA